MDRITEKLVQAIGLLTEVMQTETEVKKIEVLVNGNKILETELESLRRTLASRNEGPSKPLVSQPKISIQGIPIGEQKSSKNTDLSPEQRFSLMLEQCPFMAIFYDEQEKSMDIPRLRANFDIQSRGQQLMLAFMKVVWDADSSWFESIDTAPILRHFSELDSNHQQIIADWTTAPYWI